ncbi:MAG: hypothetical protein ACEY3M_15545 [Wolbachia sp.]
MRTTYTELLADYYVSYDNWYNSMIEINMDLVRAQQARRALDYLVQGWIGALKLLGH